MKKRLAYLLVITCTLLLIVPSLFTAKATSNNTAESRYIVKLKGNAVLSLDDSVDVVKKLKPNLLVIKATDTEVQNIKKKAKSQIEYIEKDGLITISTSDPPPLKAGFKQVYNWNMSEVDASEAWSKGYTGKGVKVAIVDSGIDQSHEDLQFVTEKSLTGSSPQDFVGHGTHVAGIIAARNNGVGVVGVAPDAELYIAKALDPGVFGGATGNISDVVAGIQWAIDQNVDIISMSIGTTVNYQSMHDVIQEAYNRGILLVAASGNSTTNVDLYPAKYPEVIAVGSIDNKLNLSTFSNFGDKQEVVAPGTNILSTYINNTYTYMSGTSMAAPHVTGFLADLKQEYPDKTNVELRQILDQTIYDLGDKGKDSTFGYGLVDFQPPCYSDVTNTFWGKNAICYDTSKGWLGGYPDSTFKPNNDITRAETAKVFGKALNLTVVNTPNYKDVPDTYWGVQYIETMKFNHYLNGYPDGEFKPDNHMTRAESASLVYNILHDKVNVSGDTVDYPDVSKSNWAYNSIEFASKLGIFHGNPDHTFNPNGYITRTEMATVLMNIDKKTDVLK